MSVCSSHIMFASGLSSSLARKVQNSGMKVSGISLLDIFVHILMKGMLDTKLARIYYKARSFVIFVLISMGFVMRN